MIRFLQTPGKTKKIVLGGLLLIICAAMVITLVPGGMLGDAFGYGGVNTAGILARVGSQQVTTAEVQKIADQMIRQRFPSGVPEQFRDILRPQAMQQAAQSLITQKALENEADRLGFRVTDAEVAEYLQHSPYASQLFRNGAPVNQAEYEGFVRQNFDMAVPEFESMLKTALLISKLRAMVEGSVSVSNAEMQAEYKQQNTKVKFDYAVITNDQIMKEIKPTEAELKAYYDSHKAQYQNSIPEKRKFKYVFIENAKLAKEIPISQDDVQRYYQAHQDLYRVQDQVTVRHILIKTPPPGPDGKVDQKAVDAAKQKAEDILKKLKAGGNFEQLAKQYSEDEASKAKGGLIGPIVRGQTDPEFEKAAFSLPKGGTSDVVKSVFGFHIIHVDEKQTAHVKPLEEVRPEIEAALRQERVGTRAKTLADKITAQAKTAGLDKAAAANGAGPALTSGLLARADSIPEIGSAPELSSAVFSAAPNAAPDEVQLPQGWVVYQVLEVKPPATPTFEEARTQVENQFKSERAGQLLQQKTQELADRAHAEHNLKKAAAALGATMKTSQSVAPTDQVPEIGSLSGTASEIFSLKQGEISSPIMTGRSGVVAALLERQEPSAADFDKAKEQLREELLQRKRTEVMEIFAANLRQRLEKEKKIRINDQEWNRLTARESGS